MKIKEPPLVTVAIPLYNHAQFVEKCLDSITEETYPRIEVLVLDDGSTDASFEIVEKWQSKRKHGFSNFVLKRQENQGIPRTINKLVAMANGEYIALLASDDYLLPGGIEARIHHLEKHPHLLAVFGDCLVVNEQDEVICQSGVSQFHFKAARMDALKNEKLMTLETIIRWSVPGPVFLMRKSTCDVAGYYDETLTVEDRDYYFRLLAMKALGFVGYKVACYRWHSNNVVKSPVGGDRRRESLSTAALNAAGIAKGLLRMVFLLDAKRVSNPGWRKALNDNGIAGAVHSICISAIWMLLKTYQNVRLWASRCHT